MKYLGKTLLTDLTGTPYESFTKEQWVLTFIENYGGIDGAHHKDWVLDQVVRILHGTTVLVALAKWSDGTENYRFNLDEPPPSYWQWVNEMKAGEDGPETYDYEFGIAP